MGLKNLAIAEKVTMVDAMDVEIVPYNPKMAEELAEMYNSWDDLWIGGFTQGVPFDAERVRDRYDKMSAIAILIAIKKSDSRPVGSCTLHEHVRDKDAAYVGVLGVSPEALGKKVGKKLLLHAIGIVRKQGYNRVDLNTWPGNMRAVPLYKKVGLMWDPEGDGVHMEDYIPGILQHPLCKPFFEGTEDNEWYEFLQREITQAPDNMKDKGMDVYEYTFKRNDDLLRVVVDRHARGISTIDRTIAGQRILLSTRIESHKVLCGVSSNYILEFTNDTDEKKTLGVDLRSFNSLSFGDAAPGKLEVEPGSSEKLLLPFTVSSSAPIHRENLRTPEITAEITLDGDSSELHTGMIVKPIADVRDRWPHPRIIPGGNVEVPLIVLSSIKTHAQADLLLETSHHSLNIKPRQVEIDISNEGISGAVVQIEASKDTPVGAHHISARVRVHQDSSEENGSITTRAFSIPIFCAESGDVSGFRNERNREVIINGPDYQAVFSYEGANLSVRHIASGETLFRVRSQVGPPFGIDAFRYVERECTLEEGNDGLTVIMKGKHPDRPLEIEDRVLFQSYTGLIVHEVWTRNIGTSDHNYQVRFFGGGQGISLSPGEGIVPLRDAFVKQPLLHGLFSYPSLPDSPQAYSEGWIASNTRATTRGYVFDLDTLDRIRTSNGDVIYLQYPLISSRPKERQRASQSYLITKANSWREIRQVWREKVRRGFVNRFEERERKKTKPMIDISVPPCIVLEKRECEFEVSIKKNIGAPFTADIRVEPPEGWTAELVDNDNKKRSSSPLSKMEIKEKQTLKVILRPDASLNAGFGVYSGRIILQSTSSFREDFTVIQLGDSTGKVNVTAIEDQAKKSFKIENGLLSFRTSPNYGGCIYSLKNRQGTEFLVSTYPDGTPKPGSFLKNYFGGIQPLTWDQEFHEDLSNAETNKEHMSAKSIAVGSWTGIELSWKGRIQKSVRGVSFRLQYLTAPSSPLVAARWVIKNTTSATIKLRPSFIIDPAIDGDSSKINAILDWEKHPQRIRISPYPISVVPSSDYVWLENIESEGMEESLGIISPSETSEALFVTAGDIVLAGTVSHVIQLSPEEEYIATTWFFVNPDTKDEISGLQKIAENLI